MQAVFLDGTLEDRMLVIPNKSVQVVLTDLPYGTGQRNAYNTPVNLEIFWTQTKRVLADGGVVLLFADHLFAFDLFDSNRKWYKYKWYWIKNTATGGQNAAYAPLQNVEEILTFYPKAPYYTPPMSQGHPPLKKLKRKEREENTYGKQTEHYSTREGRTDRYPVRSIVGISTVPNGPGRIHSAQKPVELIRYLLGAYGREGTTVLDAASGSGTTAIAAHGCGMASISIEPDRYMMGRAIARVGEECKDLTIYRQ